VIVEVHDDPKPAKILDRWHAALSLTGKIYGKIRRISRLFRHNLPKYFDVEPHEVAA
jgi:hypothetical protein